jgi:hypothetical protein
VPGRLAEMISFVPVLHTAEDQVRRLLREGQTRATPLGLDAEMGSTGRKWIPMSYFAWRAIAAGVAR